MKYPNPFVAEMVIQGKKHGVPHNILLGMFRAGLSKDQIKEIVRKWPDELRE